LYFLAIESVTEVRGGSIRIAKRFCKGEPVGLSLEAKQSFAYGAACPAAK
jgi:hypothetical protein